MLSNILAGISWQPAELYYGLLGEGEGDPRRGAAVGDTKAPERTALKRSVPKASAYTESKETEPHKPHFNPWAIHSFIHLGIHPPLHLSLHPSLHPSVHPSSRQILTSAHFALSLHLGASKKYFYLSN